MSLTLNEGNWWECSGDELWATNLIAAVGTKLKEISQWFSIVRGIKNQNLHFSQSLLKK